jgi:hypothetical protein
MVEAAWDVIGASSGNHRVGTMSVAAPTRKEQDAIAKVASNARLQRPLSMPPPFNHPHGVGLLLAAPAALLALYPIFALAARLCA